MKDSPLVLGLAKDGIIFASDAPRPRSGPKKVVNLRNYDFISAGRDGIWSYDLLEGQVQ